MTTSISLIQGCRAVIAAGFLCSATAGLANEPPVARPDGPYTTHNNPIHGGEDLDRILDNDTDDQDAVYLSGPIDDPNHPLSDDAAVTKLNASTIRYRPHAGFVGTDTFRYRINDGELFHSAIVTVVVTANRAPVAEPESVSTPAGQSITIPVLVGDSDPDGDPVALSGPIDDPNHPLSDHATVIKSGSNILYTPHSGFVGTDTFRYRINDGELFHSAIVTVEVTGGSQNNASPDMEIRIQSTGSVLPPSGDVNLGTTYLGEPVNGWLEIHNVGTAGTTLEILGSALQNIVWQISFGGVTPSSIPAQGAPATMLVHLKAERVGSFTYDYWLRTNDPEPETFLFSASGSVIDPEIKVESVGGSEIFDDAADPSPFSAAVGATASRVYTVTNEGTTSLSLTRPGQLLAAGCGDFEVASGLTTGLVQSGESASFEISMRTTTAGAKACTVELLSNDNDERTFDFAVTGTVSGGGAVGKCSQNPEGALGGPMAEIRRALDGEPPTCDWRRDWASLSRWQAQGSQNHPVLAAAIGLLREPTNEDLHDWWVGYLVAQLGGTPLDAQGNEIPTADHVKYWGSTELSSNTYEHAVVASVVAAHFAAVSNDLDGITSAAERYLAARMAVWAASASSAWPGDVTFRRGAGSKRPAPNYTRGHYLALAGMRNHANHYARPERVGLFDRAVFDIAPNEAARVESNELSALLDRLEDLWDDRGRERHELYGLDSGRKGALAGLVSGTQPADFLTHFFLSNVRTIEPYSIMGWTSGGDRGKRLSLLDSNRNRNTTPTYGMLYSPGSNTVSALYPWSHEEVDSHSCVKCRNADGGSFHRKCVSLGKAGLDGGLVWAENRPESSQQEACHRDIQDHFTVPTAPTHFCLQFSPDGNASWENLCDVSSIGTDSGSLACGAPSTAGLIGHWDFQEGGDLGLDVSGHGHHGSAVGLPQQVIGRSGDEKALQLSGSSYISLPPLAADLDLGSALTLEGWMKVDSHPWFNGIRAWRPFILSSDRFYVANYADSTGWQILTSSLPVPVGEWYHIAGVFEDGVMRLYVNGQLAGEQIVPFDHVAAGGNYFNTAIGARARGSNGADGFFVGELDDLKIYTRALSAGEIHHAAGCP